MWCDTSTFNAAEQLFVVTDSPATVSTQAPKYNTAFFDGAVNDERTVTKGKPKPKFRPGNGHNQTVAKSARAN